MIKEGINKQKMTFREGSQHHGGGYTIPFPFHYQKEGSTYETDRHS